ncbi:MAG TPA: hemolysin family protein, partial [Tepidisphaeraceae bacterium]|nr:hemolysin family protein [Tepidisphaeraceae bacterium]
RLEDYLVSYKRSDWLEYTIEHRLDLIYVTAVGRLLANLFFLLLPLAILHDTQNSRWIEYTAAMFIASILGLVFSVTLPTALAQYAGEPIVALCVRFLHVIRIVFFPLTKLMHAVDSLVRQAAGARAEPEPEQVEKDILSAVEEGEKEGIVGTEEREIIESVIEFHDTQAAQTMTARPEIVAVEVGATLDEIKQTFEESGHSRLPVYDGTLDHIVGVLYARDLLKYLGLHPNEFNIHDVIRPAVFVPEIKPLRDLLHEFRQQKVHIAIVLDEYGGTAGLVTIEDILEELVGEITDEHEPQGPAMLKKLSPTTFEADARVYIDEINRQLGLNLPEDQGYDTIGGFVSTTLGRIPQTGTTFEHGSARFTVLDAEPQRVKHLRIEMLPQTVRDQS